MMAFLLSVILAGLFLAALFFVAFQGAKKSRSPGALNLSSLLSLPAISYPRTQFLFDRGDFDYLRRIGAHAAAWELRRDRRAAALLWLRGLKVDMQRLCLFQRCLARAGVRTSTLTGLSLTANLLLFYTAYGFLYLSVLILGPYALHRVWGLLTNCSRSTLGLLETLCAKLPSPLPEPIQAQFAARPPAQG